MKSIEPFLQQALAKVEQLKVAEATRSQALDTAIETFKADQVKQRKAADASELRNEGNSFRQGEPVQIDSAPCALALSAHGPDHSLHEEPCALLAPAQQRSADDEVAIVLCGPASAGPAAALQRCRRSRRRLPWPADEVEKLTEQFTAHIRATAASNGNDVAVLRQGYLHKRSTGMLKEWQRRYFVLDSLGMLYYYSSKVQPCLWVPAGWVALSAAAAVRGLLPCWAAALLRAAGLTGASA